MRKIMKNRIILSVLLSVFYGMGLHAQDIKVTGQVTDEAGEPVIAATVYQQDRTSNGVLTDADGNYSISLPSGASLVFSCLGYRDVTEAVGGRTKIDIVLEEDAEILDAAELVETGYGTVARRDLTGSIASMNMDNLRKTSSTSFDGALQGRIAGVVVTTSDGQVGSTANIVIRGNNSLTQSNEPLYVIDGFPSESSYAASINPNDIASIDVLKDASSTAIYGARGANGVIVITTKQGVEGKPKINFSSSWSISSVVNRPEMMNGYEYVEYYDEYCTASGLTNSFWNDTEGNYNVYTLSDYEGMTGIDWQDQVYRNAFTQQYNFSVSGGSKTTGSNYNISLSALDNDGVIIASNFQRYSGKINYSQNIGRKIRLNFNVSYSRSIQNGSTPSSSTSSSAVSTYLLYSVLGYRPIAPIGRDQSLLYDMVDSEVSASADYRFNPILSTNNEYRKKISDLVWSNAAFNYEIIPGLRLRITGGYTYYNYENQSFDNSQTNSGWENSYTGYGPNGSIGFTRRTSWVNENTLTWDKHIRSRHHLQLLGGFTMQGESLKYHGVRAIHLSTEALGINGLHTGDYQPVTPYQRDWRLMSGLFRLNYNYKYRYYLTASFRADGSSKFPKSNQWGYFPSVGLSWNVNRENWLKNSRWLTNLKLRASYGMTGNNRTSTPYDFYSQITTSPGSVNNVDYVFGGSYIPGYYPSNMANERLKWETTAQYDIGVDFAMFDNRFKLTADVYLKDTEDLLLNATIPSSSGYTTAMLNIGSIRNKGLELSIEAVPVRTKNFEWDMNFNIAFNRNTVTALSMDQYSLFSTVSWNTAYSGQNAYVTQIGKPTGLMYGYIYEGTYKEDEFNSGTNLKRGIPYLEGVGQAAVRPGDPKYRDINGDGVINDSDRTIIGSGQPLHTGGFTNTFWFYGFDLAVFFNWSYGNDILNANKLIFENGRVQSLNQFKSYKGHYSAGNPDSDIPRVYASGVDNYSSRVVEDGSFLRLKNITLGYTLPRRILRRMKFDTFRIFVSADNIHTFTKYSGPDPEVSTRNSVLTPGFDWSAYPRAFTFTGGLSFTF